MQRSLEGRRCPRANPVDRPGDGASSPRKRENHSPPDRGRSDPCSSRRRAGTNRRARTRAVAVLRPGGRADAARRRPFEAGTSGQVVGAVARGRRPCAGLLDHVLALRHCAMEGAARQRQGHVAIRGGVPRVLSKGARAAPFSSPLTLSTWRRCRSRRFRDRAGGAGVRHFENGQTVNAPIAGTHGSAAWVSESGASRLATRRSRTWPPVRRRRDQDHHQRRASNRRGDRCRRLPGVRVRRAHRRTGRERIHPGRRLGEAAWTRHGRERDHGRHRRHRLSDQLQARRSENRLQDAAAGVSAHRLLADRRRRLRRAGALADSSGALVLPSLQFDPPASSAAPCSSPGDLPAPAANAKSLVFGDFKLGYGVRACANALTRQDEIHSDQGQVGFRMFARLDRPAAAH